MRVSVLDQSPVPYGSTPGDALANSVDLARRTEALGFHRYWVAEHHNMEGLAGSSPEVLVAHLAANTNHIRIGSGGVMLTHYSGLKVAETFRVLHALHPGRIDLGVGRAPGSDSLTAAALARGTQPLGIEYYPSQLEEMVQFLDDAIPLDSPLAPVHARPLMPGGPEVWVLASSADGAGLAAHFGLPLAWADFIGPDGDRVTAAYRRQYQPSDRAPEPTVLVTTSAICAETDDEADRLATSIRQWRAGGLQGTIPPPGETGRPDPLAIAPAHQRDKPLLAGSPDRVASALSDLVDAFGADELMVVTICHNHAARVRSYELLANELDLS